LVLWPLLLVGSITGYVGGFGERPSTFITGMIVFVFFFALNLYVVVRMIAEVHASGHGLEFRMVSGRSSSIGWQEIARLHISSGGRSGFRVETRTGAVFSIESSLPRCTQLLRLIEERLQRAGGSLEGSTSWSSNVSRD
jgi:hypothetical protein